MAKATTNSMNPPVYQAYTLFSCCLKAALLEALKTPPVFSDVIPLISVLLNFGQAVFLVQLVHIAGIEPNDDHIDDQ